MVDIHTHLLFGVDDGPETLDESVEMIKKAKQLGFSEFYLTSHYAKGKYMNENYEKNFLVLNKRVEELNLDVKLHRGNEVYLDENIDETLSSRGYNILFEKKILVEFSPMTVPQIGKRMLQKVIDRGYEPILAHVERYHNFKGSELVDLKKLGVKLQVNISGEKPRYIRRLLEEGYIDFLGSDTHRVNKRSYDIEEELEEIKKLVGLKDLKRMTTLKKVDEEDLGDEEKRFSAGIFGSIFRNIFSGVGLRSDS